MRYGGGSTKRGTPRGEGEESLGGKATYGYVAGEKERLLPFDETLHLGMQRLHHELGRDFLVLGLLGPCYDVAVLRGK